MIFDTLFIVFYTVEAEDLEEDLDEEILESAEAFRRRLLAGTQAANARMVEAMHTRRKYHLRIHPRPFVGPQP